MRISVGHVYDYDDSVALDVEDFDPVCRINLRGTFLRSRAVLPGMVLQGYGSVLHVASIAGKEGNAEMVAHSASKAGLIGIVKAQGKEYRDGCHRQRSCAGGHSYRDGRRDAHARRCAMADRIHMRLTGTFTRPQRRLLDRLARV